MQSAPVVSADEARQVFKDHPFKLLIIDGDSFAHRAYHALPPLTRKSDGLPTRECSGGSQPAACRTPDGGNAFRCY